MNCKNCGAEFQENVNFCPDCDESTEAVEVKAPGMKWHKFKAYFEMPLSAIVNLFVGVLLVPDVMNKLIDFIPDAERLYAIDGYTYFLNFNSIKILNIVFAFISVALALYYAYVSFALIKYKKGATKHIYISLVLSETVGLIYSIAMLILMSIAFEFKAESIFELVKTLISRVVAVVFWTLIYMKYYDKRKHLFIN